MMVKCGVGSSEWQESAEKIQMRYEERMKGNEWRSSNEGINAVSSSIEESYIQMCKRELLEAADAFTLKQESRLDMNEEEMKRRGLLGSTSVSYTHLTLPTICSV